ncbi:hypothetical protein AcV5_005463, partial [Taiwanofungus camphoratus]
MPPHIVSNVDLELMEMEEDPIEVVEDPQMWDLLEDVCHEPDDVEGNLLPEKHQSHVELHWHCL